MCEIQLVYGFGKRIDKKSYKKFKNLLNCGSRLNNDAHGFLQLTTNTIYMDKASKLQKLFQKMKYDKETRFLLGHNRFATSGGTAFNDNHPFKIEHKYYWVHNGILFNDSELKDKYNLSYNSDTDSEVIGHLIDYFVTQKKITVEKAIIKTIEELSGTYSVVLYDLKTRRIYYFKDDATEFYFCMDSQNMLFGTTIKDNLSRQGHAKGLHEHWEFELIPKPYTVYEFTYKGLVALSTADENAIQHTSGYWGEEVTKFKTYSVYENDCEYCGQYTGVLNYSENTNMYICDMCQEEEEHDLKKIEDWEYDKKTYNPKQKTKNKRKAYISNLERFM